jgi:Uma2 family endonuclease
MTIQPRLVTGKEFMAMSRAEPSELVEGSIVAMIPTGGLHSNCEGNFYAALRG